MDGRPPADGSESGTSFVGGSNLAVFEQSDNQAAGWAFVEYLSRPEVQVTWYETVSDLPSVQSAWDDEALAGDELLAAFGEQLDDAKAPPAIPTWEQVAVGDRRPDRAGRPSAMPRRRTAAQRCRRRLSRSAPAL